MRTTIQKTLQREGLPSQAGEGAALAGEIFAQTTPPGPGGAHRRAAWVARSFSLSGRQPTNYTKGQYKHFRQLSEVEQAAIRKF